MEATRPFVRGFAEIDQIWLSYGAIIGTILTTVSNVIGTLYIVPRMLYSLSSDNLIFPIFGKVFGVNKVPINGLILSGMISLILAVFFKISAIAELLSMGILLTFVFAGMCLLLIRYKNLKISNKKVNEYECVSIESNMKSFSNMKINNNNTNLTETKKTFPRLKPAWEQYWPLGTKFSLSGYLHLLIIAIALTILITGSVLILLSLAGMHFLLKIMTILITVVILLGLLFLFYFFEPNEDKEIVEKGNLLSNKSMPEEIYLVPFMPLIPFLAIIINLSLLFRLQLTTWTRFLIWTMFGMNKMGNF